jgi:hypothetical protein
MRYTKLTFALLGFAAVLVAADPFEGIWKLNVAKSKYKKGAPNKDSTITITTSGSNLDVSTAGTSADGAPVSVHYTVPAKGGEGKIISGPWEAVSAKRPGDKERVTSFSKGGKVIYTVRSSISADGKTITTNASGTNAAGKEVVGTNVYEKQ